MRSTTGASGLGSDQVWGVRAGLGRAALSITLAVASLSIVAVGAPSPAKAAGAPLSCDGSTIYSYQRSGSAASVFALDTSTIGGASVTATLVTTVPGGSNGNALGITKGGTAMYAVDQTTSSVNSAVIHGYDTSTQAWTTYTKNGSGSNSSFVAGAVDPATGIYYYVNYTAGTSSSPGTATVYGFDTNTNTPISGAIATFPLPTGNGTSANNGDIAFDAAGNMFVLASTGTAGSNSGKVGIGVVKGPIPTTGSANPPKLTDNVLNLFSDTNTYNGIAFDNAGNLYVGGQPGNKAPGVLTKLDPNTGAVIAGPTPLSSNAQSLGTVDLGACSLNPTLALQKDIVGRYKTGDQFGLSISGDGVRGGNSATTSGNTTGIQTNAVAGPIIARSGATYTLTETGVGGDLLNYTTTYACVDTANNNAPVTSGTGQSFTLQFPDTTGVSPAIVCTFRNTPLAPAITLQKTVAEKTLTVGETLHYSFLVTNTGDVTLAPVTIAEEVFTGHGTPPTVTCPAGADSLAPNASVTCTATYVVTQDDVDAGSVNNTATATGTTPAGELIKSPPSSASVGGTSNPSISVEKSASPSSFSAAGQTITYSFLVTNTGNVTLSAVQVNDFDLPGLSAITCPQDTLGAGASQTCTATYVTTAGDVDAGSVTNTATAQGNPPGSTTAVESSPSTATVPAEQAASIAVLKSAEPGSFAAAGETIHYSFLVTNTGNVTLTGVQVNDDDLPGLSAIDCPDATLAAGASQTCHAHYVTTQADVDAGSVMNSATAQGDPPGSTTPVVSDPSQATVPAEQAASITRAEVRVSLVVLGGGAADHL